MSAVAVLGAGSWGTALAAHLAAKGESVRIWAFEAEVVAGINQGHENPVYLPGIALPPGLRAYADAADAVRGAPVVLSVSPSHVTRSVLRPLASAVDPAALVVSATKGIEQDSLALMHEVIAECLPGRPVAVLSGPSFAKEVAEGQPTAVVAASTAAEAAARTQALFAGRRFRVYSHDDVTGVELGGALKNVVAIAAGMLEGLGLGHNPRAALITRGLAEMTRLGVAMGGDPLTFAGLAGMGDLILTCTGGLSRNRSLGEFLGRGGSAADWVRENRMVAEGARTADAAVRLAARHGVELPICSQVAAILRGEQRAADAVVELMERDLKAEQWR
ncbi:MAG TPA: NAD(P)H-dependent glycerol-3-phosphate dehydrogenase [Gemmatimonadales bacterium]|nr:NAD(P)H-dependent glycerol-3-phosphate dehydrogenase [Gemmatimonadales bacterium]